MDLKAYQAQIKELIPLRNEPDFNDLLNNVLFGESNSDKFLIKMEITRLVKPCQRILDIRDKVIEPCEIFEQDNLKHYLTKPTMAVLQKSIQLYGLYTVGAFESVHEFIAEQKIKLKNEQLNPKEVIIKEEQCELLSLSQKNKRGAPRMFFVSDVILTLDDGKKVTAQTSNISATGLKIKLQSSLHINNQSLLHVTFVGLDLEYHDAVLREQIHYQLVKQENENTEIRYFYLNYIDENKRFTTFISEFIRLNQYKYKIDVHYYYQLAKISALKFSYLEQMNSLPIYLDAKDIFPLLFSLKNHANKALLNEWHCDGIDQLPYLFHELRLIKFLVQERLNTTVYTFTHTIKGKPYFLSATEEELLTTGLKKIFINYGRSKSSWRVYHLTLEPCHYSPTTHYSLTEPAPEVFNKVSHMATLQRLSKAYPFDIESELNTGDVNKLNQFVHRPDDTISASTIFTLFSDELRKEERYLYKSQLSVSSGTDNYNGHIIDFSYSGLKIQLEQISPFSVSSKLTVNLTELQKISKKYPLSALQYKVVKTGSKNILHLQVCSPKTLQICQQFFAVLVKNNAKHFTCVPLKERKQPTPKHLINIAEESLINAVFFIRKVSGRPKITFSAIDTPDHPLHQLFSLHSNNNQELNYYPIANNQLYERLIQQPFRENDGKNISKEALIYIKAVKDKNQQYKITSFLDEDFKSEDEKVNFVKESQFNATFYAIHYRLTALPKADLSCIKSEIRAISRFAIHLTKKLEEELHAINAMVEITDRTNDIIKAVENRVI